MNNKKTKTRINEYNVEVDVDFYVDIEDLYENFTAENINELVKLLIEDGHVERHEVDQVSLHQQEYLEALRTIACAYHNISKEDEDTIFKIAKKF